MSCGCEDDKDKPKIEQLDPVEAIPTYKMGITCYCGLARLLPSGLKEGDTVTLPACPKCGRQFMGRYVNKDGEKGVEV
jgi:hypothetical protein